jgi:hypothetical protein
VKVQEEMITAESITLIVSRSRQFWILSSNFCSQLKTGKNGYGKRGTEILRKAMDRAARGEQHKAYEFHLPDKLRFGVD